MAILLSPLEIGITAGRRAARRQSVSGVNAGGAVAADLYRTKVCEALVADWLLTGTCVGGINPRLRAAGNSDRWWCGGREIQR